MFYETGYRFFDRASMPNICEEAWIGLSFGGFLDEHVLAFSL